MLELWERLQCPLVFQAICVKLSFIFDQDLIDLPLVGRAFMWSNNRDPPSWSGIDRFLASFDWEAQFHEVSHMRLQSLCSDHFHILLDCGDFHKGKRYFKFESIWLKEKGFAGKVKQWWTSYCFQGSPSFIMASRLKEASFERIMRS